MNPTTMLADFAKEGVVLSLNTHGGIRASGGREAVARMLPIIKQHKPELLAALAGRPLQATPQPETLMDECKRLTVEIMVDGRCHIHLSGQGAGRGQCAGRGLCPA